MARQRRRRQRTLLFEHEDRDLIRLSEYEQVGGYQSLRKALDLEPQQILDELLAANLRGRGGAGFPMGKKASFLPKPDASPKPIYLVANADESEPGTFKDREIMARLPHMFIEGILIAARAIGASAAFIYLRGEYLAEFEIIRDALEEARRSGLAGTNILGTGWKLPIVVHRGAGAYICGEETALLESLEGKRGSHALSRPFRPSPGCTRHRRSSTTSRCSPRSPRSSH